MEKRIVFILLIVLAPLIMFSQEPEKNFFPAIGSFQLLDVVKQKNIVIPADHKRLSLFIFLSPECPICQNYTKTLKELQQQFKQDVQLFAIVPGKAYSVADINEFEKKYQTGFKYLIDTKQHLTKYLGAYVTPQAILLNSKFQLMYTGAIDDWAVAPGNKRLYASQHYLADAIKQTLKSTPVVVAKTKAVGCRINDY